MKRAFQLVRGKRNVVVAVSVLLVVAASTIAYYYAVYLPSTCVPSTGIKRNFVIIVDSRSGYNGSIHHMLPYPTMNAQKGDAVVMRLINNDSSQVFGLEVDFYSTNGVVARPGETKSMCFQATKIGQFNVIDPIFTTIDHFEWAQLNVQ